MVNDVILGLVLGHFLRTHADAIADAVADSVQYFTIEHVEAMVQWLMGWPSGIKLNSNLDAFFGNVCLTSLALWRGARRSRGLHPRVGDMRGSPTPACRLSCGGHAQSRTPCCCKTCRRSST